MQEFLSWMDQLFFQLQALMAEKYSNSVTDLLIFAILLSLLFLFLHGRRTREGRVHRRMIGMVVGGWGSRGKSGTERLKAALFNSQGLSVLCKTTGCEPVLLHGGRFGPLEEIPLHRPFDKATIWEQLDVLKIAARAKVDVFLWECMGLEPDYVRIMQRDWMRDDLSTITNTYPDHEDIQGPTGFDVAESIASFIPQGSTVLTAEQTMLPLLKKRSRANGSRIEAIDARELNSITADVLQRFPYAEHPHNIALVLRLAKAIGIKKDFALKEMADRIKPDIGVLKVYPALTCPDRQLRLEFSNGFSANEKFGCLSNWNRLGYADLDLDRQPRIWLSTLVNNRDDRITRSQVFADLLVHELDLDAIYLVGSNLDGFERFYLQALNDLMARLDLSTADKCCETLEKYRQRLRIPRDAESLLARMGHLCEEAEIFRASLESSDLKPTAWPDDAGISESYLEWKVLWQRTRESRETRLTAKAIRDFIGKRLRQRLIRVPDKEQKPAGRLLDFLLEQTPRGFEHKMHGIQNIKGVGLLWIEALESRNFQRELTEDQAVATQKGPRVLRGLARPTQEAIKTRRMRRIYRDFASGRYSASEARQIIRNLQGG